MTFAKGVCRALLQWRADSNLAELGPDPEPACSCQQTFCQHFEQGNYESAHLPLPPTTSAASSAEVF